MRSTQVGLLCLAIGAASAVHAAEEPRRMGIMRTASGSYLGVALADVRADDLARLKITEERGALVKEVKAGSPAANAGIREGDVIVRYQGDPVTSVAQVSRMVRETPPGRKVTVEVSRAGSLQKLSAVIGERADEGIFDRSVGHFLDDLDLEMRNVLRHPGGAKLGIEYQELSDQLASYFKLEDQHGVLVSAVDADGPAARAGLKAGDVIVKVNDATIRDGSELRQQLRRVESGSEVTLGIRRDGRPMEMKVKIGPLSKPRIEPAGKPT